MAPYPLYFALIFAVGFGVGYAVRARISYKRRKAARRARGL
jgi:hypothetical protein